MPQPAHARMLVASLETEVAAYLEHTATNAMPRATPVSALRYRCGDLRDETLQTCSLGLAARFLQDRAVVVGVEVAADEAHLVLGRDAEVDCVGVGVAPRAREA